MDRQYIKFKESLEARYPQVCEDCFQGVAERLKQSSYTAKTDHLRRLLDKTKNHTIARRRNTTWLDVLSFLGQLLWTFGIFAQLVYDSWGCLGFVRHQLAHALSVDAIVDDLPIGSDADGSNSWLFYLATRLRSALSNSDVPASAVLECPSAGLARWGLILTAASLWWNPKFKEGIRGYDRHITGFREWYTYQGLLLTARALFWFISGTATLSRIDAPAAIGAHFFMLCFTVMVVRSARKGIKVDFGPLFTPMSPESMIKHIRPKKKSTFKGDDMSQALKSIMGGPQSLQHATPTRQNNFNQEANHSSSIQRYHSSSPPQRSAMTLSTSSPRDPRDLLGIPRTVPSLADMTEQEVTQYLATGHVPPRLQDQPANDLSDDVMDLDIQETPTYRAFAPTRTPRQTNNLFNQAPVSASPSPFWYKGLPAAPVAPAHKLRNPPNAPRLLAHTEEAKENFFRSMTAGRRETHLLPPEPVRQASPELDDPFSFQGRGARQEVEFAQPRFFPPAPSTAGTVDGLADMFSQAFSLQVEEEAAQAALSSAAEKSVREKKNRRLLSAVVLLVALAGWNYSFVKPALWELKVPLGAMLVCGLIALESLFDAFLVWSREQQPGLQSSGSALFAAAKSAGTAYVAYGIVARGGDYVNCQSLGNAAVMGMFLEEACLYVLQR